VLRAFTNDRSRWSVGELSSDLGLNKSLVSKTLREFQEAGFLRQDPRSREYTVGVQAVALGGQYMNESALVREAIVLMRRLTDRSGQTTALAILDDINVLYLVAVEGRLFLDVGWRVGTWLPFHATAVGKALFAFADDALLERAIAESGIRSLGPNTVGDSKALKAQLQKVRKSGVAETREETMGGLAAQAVPVFGEGQEVVAALGFVYPVHLLTPSKRKTYREMLHMAARTLSAKLGAGVYPYGER
jgi:DNA-binding IclR family transcriptional regulator